MDYNLRMASGEQGSRQAVRATDPESDGTLGKDLASEDIFEILRMILVGASLTEVLTSVARVVESQREGMLCSVWLLDQDRVHMRAIAAPTLPESYVAALDGFAVGPQGGSCGAAVNQRKPVFVSDVLTDPILEQVRDVIAAYGIRACWSAPIISHQGEILGTFAFYFRSVRSPSPRDIQLIENATSIAGIAIERKKAEENLRRSEWSLLEAQRLGHSGSWSVDVSSGIVTTSPEMLRSFHVKPGDDCSSPDFWFNTIHPEDRKRIRDLFERCVIEKTDYEAHYRLLLPNGTIKYQHSIGRPIVNEKGDLVEFVGTAIDVTEQAQAEEKLRRSEADLLEGQRLTHTLTWRYDVSSRKVTNTPEANRIYGFKGDEDTSDPELYFEMIHPDDRKRVRELFERCTVLKIKYEADYTIILPDANIRHIHATGHPVLNESGDLVEWVGTTMDVTEQAQARIKLEKAFEEIKRLKDRLNDENLALREQIDQAFMFEEIVGASPALQTVLSSILKVAPTDSTVLITGETGTGKELIARAIHKHSQRSGQAFISVNCASIPSSLIASELFGHEKGAFTGALLQRQGRFELAHSGTIFLDEVGELPAETQKRYAEKARKQISKIDKNTLKLCQSYHWPGNIRELQNIVERSVILCSGDTFWIDEAWLSSQGAPRPKSSGPLVQTVQNYEKELIEGALAESNGKVAGPNGAAAKLGIPRATLDFKIKQLKIKKNTIR